MTGREGAGGSAKQTKRPGSKRAVRLRKNEIAFALPRSGGKKMPTVSEPRWQAASQN
jgi:hypothetical protein